MSGLAALLAGHTPPDLYQWHSAAQVEDIRHAVEVAGWTFRHFDGWTTEDKEAFLKGMAAALDAPDQAAQDLPSLESALGEVSPGGGAGVVLLWDGWSPLARHDEATFAEALRMLGDRARSREGGPLAVVLRGDGPALELEELPHKH